MPSATDLKATSLSSSLVTSPPSAALESLHMSPRTEGAPSSTTQGQSSDDESGPNNTMNMMHLQADDAFALDALPPIAAAAEPPSPKCCSYCRTTQTPMWRHGPVGFDPLCNGCGVKWKRGRILAGLERAPRSPVVKKQRIQPQKLRRDARFHSFSATIQSHTFILRYISKFLPKRTLEPLPSLAINTTIHNERRQMLLKSVLEKSPLLSPSPSIRGDFRRHSISLLST
ncbi:hypothetical protein BCR33DRAFT_856862 [Rhizoclosmatium globosum]|uniref:GATA-type domain-containing protein n=1 Tax=Rhizoclosmatium globosum TaxID=329046 RepID=A0A1Y2BA72_9FUNG|nr:hypothetical protein BCR33DRAFT_856862 [Rhizoclosmatium globosum]|eukprot:ORY31752.1 hypothetical protein BCR33DRAFT_856862 [Rhizoclosmatium globosum]